MVRLLNVIRRAAPLTPTMYVGPSSDARRPMHVYANLPAMKSDPLIRLASATGCSVFAARNQFLPIVEALVALWFMEFITKIA